MKVCVLFRGENVRTKWGDHNPLRCIENWRKTIFNVVDCDCAFFTYPSPVLEELTQELKPVFVQTEGYDFQHGSASAAFHWMDEHKHEYDRFIILRFDFMYRKRVTEWIHWEKEGIILVNRDIHWPFTHFYADILFIVDSGHVPQFNKAFFVGNPYALHHIGRELLDNNIPFHLMYQNYHNMTQHPLHALSGSEEEPDIDRIHALYPCAGVGHL